MLPMAKLRTAWPEDMDVISATRAVIDAKSDFDAAIIRATTKADCDHLRDVLIHLIANLDAARVAAEWKGAKL